MLTEVVVGGTASGEKISIPLKVANRHGLISGATGTGKTVTLQVLAEQFSRAGVPVFMADVKGDLSGLTCQGKDHEKIQQRVQHNQLEGFEFQGYPVCFWDFFGEQGLNLRLTIERLGPALLSRILDLNETQTDVIHVVFKYARDKKLPILDLKDLKLLLNHVGEKRKEMQTEYGNISPASIGTIVRRTLTLEDSGGKDFFKEPSVDLKHLMHVDSSGKGFINILDARKLMFDKRLYSSFLLWMLTELFKQLEEVGDPEKPKLVFFFDEAHLLFDDAPKYLVEQIEAVVRLIRSKGVGVYFVTQSSTDISPDVLSQLGHKIQHGLRAASAKERKRIKAVAENYPSDGTMDIEKEILALGIGESIISTLNLKGLPQNARKILNSPPESQMGPIEDNVRQDVINRSLLKDIYSKDVDRESAYEILKKRREQATKEEDVEEKKLPQRRSRRQTPLEAFFKSILRALGSQLGRSLVRVLMKSVKR